jgi:hypothetical protein
MEPIPHMMGRYEKRLEYRRADGNKRLRVLTIGWLCRKHAEDDIILEERRAPGTVAKEQWQQEGLPI